MTNEEYKKIRELEYKAKQCRAAGIDPEIDDGTAWAMTNTRECGMVTDGQRFWEQPRLIQEFDVFQNGIVTMRYYLRNIPRLPRAQIVASKGKTWIKGNTLAEYFKIYETVIFDHTHRDAQGRTWRETIRGDYREYTREQEAAAK